MPNATELALLRAAKQGNENELKRILDDPILKLTVDINVLTNAVTDGIPEGNEGLSALHLAARNNHLAIMNILLNRGANIEVRSANGSTVINEAGHLGNQDVISFLVGRNADVNSVNNGGHTPLTSAILGVSNNKADVVKLLIENSAKTERKVHTMGANTPLHICAENNLEEIAKLLLEAGAYANSLNMGRETPAQIAVRLGFGGMVDLIERFEAQKNREFIELKKSVKTLGEKLTHLQPVESPQSKWKTPNFQSFNNAGFATAFAILGFAIFLIDDEIYKRKLQMFSILIIAFSFGILMDKVAHRIDRFGESASDFFKNLSQSYLKHGVVFARAEVKAEVQPRALNIENGAITATVQSGAAHANVDVHDNVKFCRVM